MLNEYKRIKGIRETEVRLLASIVNKKGKSIRSESFLVLGRKGPFFVTEHSDSKNKYTEDDTINMLEFQSTTFSWSSGESFSNR